MLRKVNSIDPGPFMHNRANVQFIKGQLRIVALQCCVWFHYNQYLHPEGCLGNKTHTSPSPPSPSSDQGKMQHNIFKCCFLYPTIEKKNGGFFLKIS